MTGRVQTVAAFLRNEASLSDLLRALGYAPANGRDWADGIVRAGKLYRVGRTAAYERVVVWLHESGQIDAGEIVADYLRERPWLADHCVAEVQP